MMWNNRGVRDFNTSQRNKWRLQDAVGYVFIACPDFSHANGKYDFRSIRDELPLSCSLAFESLKSLAREKPVRVYISDQEAFRTDVQQQLKMDESAILQAISGSLNAIRQHFPDADMLSTFYSYDEVVVARQNIPAKYRYYQSPFGPDSPLGYGPDPALPHPEKYAQISVLMKTCQKHNLCPVFMYCNPTFLLVSSLRKEIPIPIWFLDVQDPH